MTEALTEGRPLHLLKNSDCRFPLTSPERHEPHVFCGSPSIDGKPYCAAHCALAYRPKGKIPMNRRTFMKAAVIAAATPTVTALADTADHVTLSHLIELHTLAYEADSAEWAKLFDLDPSGLRREPTTGHLAQEQRCQDAKTVVERMEAAIFAYQLSTFDDVLTLTRWVHDRLSDCRCYFYQDESTVHAIFTQIARTARSATDRAP